MSRYRKHNHHSHRSPRSPRNHKNRGSGLIETLLKMFMGFGTTVSYSKDWLGRTKKTITHHDSGKSKTLTHGCGFWGATTKVVRKRDGAVTETGTVKHHWHGGSTEKTVRADGTPVERGRRKGLIFGYKYKVEGNPRPAPSMVQSSVAQTSGCHKCQGTGHVILTCRACGGLGEKHFAEQTCHTCRGTGKTEGQGPDKQNCGRCNGTGIYRPAKTVACRKCGGRKTFSVPCDRCGGRGQS